MRASIITLFTTAFLLLASLGTAEAVARYERASVQAIKEGRTAVGLEIKLTLKPEQYSTVRIGIAPGDKTFANAGNGKSFREAASDPKVGHLLHQFKAVKVTAYNDKEVTLKVLYKNNPNLKPGSKIEVVAAFSSSGKLTNYWHVYGMKTSLMNSPKRYKLPGSAAALAKKPAAKKPAKKPAAKKPAARKKPAAKKPAAKKPAKKPAAKKPAARKKPATRKKPTAASVRARTRAASSTAARKKPARKKPAAARKKPARKKPATSRARASR